MTNLDLPQIYEDLDPSNMRQRLEGFADQCQNAWEEALAFSLPRGYARVEQVMVVGMGGSAIGGDLLAGLASLEEAPGFPKPLSDHKHSFRRRKETCRKRRKRLERPPDVLSWTRDSDGLRDS